MCSCADRASASRRAQLSSAARLSWSPRGEARRRRCVPGQAAFVSRCGIARRCCQRLARPRQLRLASVREAVSCIPVRLVWTALELAFQAVRDFLPEGFWTDRPFGLELFSASLAMRSSFAASSLNLNPRDAARWLAPREALHSLHGQLPTFHVRASRLVRACSGALPDVGARRHAPGRWRSERPPEPARYTSQLRGRMSTHAWDAAA